MPVKRRRLIFELSAREKENKFKGVVAHVLQKATALNLPVVYRNELCTQPNYFIHKYPNGRLLLIEQDSHNSEEKQFALYAKDAGSKSFYCSRPERIG